MKRGHLILAYVTMPDIQSARRLSRTLLDAGLVACTNLLPHMESHYVWKKRREVSREVVLIAKTLPSCKNRLEAFIKENHPYDCPCIVFLKGEATALYAKWVRESVR